MNPLSEHLQRQKKSLSLHVSFDLGGRFLQNKLDLHLGVENGCT